MQRAINSAPGPVNSLNRTSRECDDDFLEPSSKRRKKNDNVLYSPFFPPQSKPRLDLQASAGNGSQDVCDLRSVSSADRPPGVTSSLAEYRRTNELSSVNKGRRRRRSTAAGIKKDLGLDPLSRGHTPADDCSIISGDHSQAPTSPDVLNDPPPANITSDISRPFSRKREPPKQPVPREERYKKPKYSSENLNHEDVLSADELSVDSPDAIQESQKRRTNFTNLQNRNSHHAWSRGDIRPTVFLSPSSVDKSRDELPKLRIRRACSGKSLYIGDGEQDEILSLLLKLRVADVQLENTTRTIRDLKWINIVKTKVKTVLHSATHSPCVAIKRSRTLEASDDLYIEFQSIEEAMNLVGWFSQSDSCVETAP